MPITRHADRPGTVDVFAADSPVGVRLDAATGLPVALPLRDRSAPSLPFTASLTVVTGGVETPGPVGGLRYTDTGRVPLRDLTWTGAARTDEGDTSRYVVCAVSGGWQVELEYRFAAHAPHLAFGFTLRRLPETVAPPVRDVELDFGLLLDDPDGWLLNAPGNKFRADLPVGGITAPLRVLSAGEVQGSAGVVALGRGVETFVLWPLCTTEVGDLEVWRDGRHLRARLATGLAGWAAPDGAGLSWRAVHLDRLAGSWPDVRRRIGAWQRRLGLDAPRDTPRWIRTAHIYEAHVGFSVFADGRRHERYASVADLRSDLDRIRELGFDTLQLMPRHPYPSYNVHDYADVTTTYGDETEVRRLVADCHARGMRVLLDVIMHGVIDREVLDATVRAVRTGPYADRLGEGTIDYLSRSAEDIAWSRHIVEYAPYWRAGAVERHPLTDEHPEWFMRDSANAITRRYTKAFDIARPGWRRYFIDSCADLVERLDVDGFRVDAPTYNDFASWARGREHRPSYGPLSSLGLLRDLRTRLRAVRDDAVVYTEPGGALFRAAADATYNYDEHWLIESLLAEPHPDKDRLLVRNARDLARWLRDRDATLPPGATIVHHIDSHDSIWWRLPGAQWRHERFGAAAAVALLAVFALGGGAFMTFMGGEDHIEDELRRVHALRRRLPEIAGGDVDHAAATASSDDVFVVVRSCPEATSLLAVNLSPSPVVCDVTVERPLGADPVHDHWNGRWLDAPGADGRLTLEFAPYQARLLRLRGDDRADPPRTGGAGGGSMTVRGPAPADLPALARRQSGPVPSEGAPT